MEPTGNVRKAEQPRFWLTFLFKDLAVGDIFKPDILHLTIIPWFVTEMPDEEVIKSFKKKFSGHKSFEITVGERGEFKNKRRIAVNYLAPSRQIVSIHNDALDWLSDIEGRWAVKNPYVADDFVPHIRRRKGHNFSEFEKIELTSLSLVCAFRRGDDRRTVAAKVALNEK